MTQQHIADDDGVRARIRVRSYRASDHAAVIDLFTAGLLPYGELPGQTREFWEGMVSRSLQSDLSDIEGAYFAKGGHFWVAVVDTEDGGEKEIVGIVALERKSPDEGELRRMSVKTEYRRYGVGSTLVRHLESWAAEHGFRRVFLAAGYATSHLHPFYEGSLGYTHASDKVLSEDPYFVERVLEKYFSA